MGNLRQVITFCFLIIILCSCVSKPVVPMADINEDKLAKEFHVKEDESVIYIIRPEKHVGRFQTFPLMIDRKIIGNIVDSSYVMLSVPPGKHVISLPGKYEGDYILKINTAPNKLYFIKMMVSMGFMYGNMKFDVLDDKEGMNLVKQYNLIKQLY